MRPVIGVPLRYTHMKDGRPILYLSEKVRRTLQKAGGNIFSIVPVQDLDYMDTKGNEFPELTEEEKEQIHKNLDDLDGLFFPGGTKFTPYDRYLLEIAIEKQIPVLAVCLGMQMMSCYHEEVSLKENESKIKHHQGNEDHLLTHDVVIQKDSKLYQIVGEDRIRVNSFHRYHATANSVYKTVATSIDGQIEALEYPGETFHLGVQWHPEISYDFDIPSQKIIDNFIAASSKKQHMKHEQNIVI